MKMVKQLLEAGVHFGHQTSRWNPKMKTYIFGEKSGVYIIDLEKTNELLKKAAEFMRDVARAGSYILFVGTKRQAQDIVKEQALRCGMFHVTQRWLGGTLTNYLTIRKSVKKLEKFENMKNEDTYNSLSKKEKVHLDKEIGKLNRMMEGIRKMDRLPGALFVIDSKKEEIAVKEARKLSIPVVALIDTNSDPELIDYIIPGNDDAIKSISLITAFIAESIIDGRNQFLVAGAAQDEKKEEAGKFIDDKEIEGLIEGDIKLKESKKEKKDEIIARKKRKGRI